MKQSIVEVIVYLLEAVSTCATNEEDTLTDPDVLKQKLEDAGFEPEVVANAFDWLRDLIEQQCWYAASTDVGENANTNTPTIRIFSSEEMNKIDLEVRSFILSLEYEGILETKMREIVISQLMQLKQKHVDLIDAKWVVLLVLMSKSNRNSQDIRNYLLTTMAVEV